MSLLVVAVVPALAAVAVPALLVCLILWLVNRGRTDDGGAPARAARRHELLVSTLAVVAALVAVVALFTAPIEGASPDRGIYLAVTPFAVAAVFALVRAVGELTWPRPGGDVRAAPLTRRTPWSLGGARLKALLVTGGTLAVGLVLTGITADETGRMFTTAPMALPDGGVVSGSTGPYPGWPYALPMLAGTAVVAVATWSAMTAITRRRPLAGVPAAHDDAVRRTSANRLLAGVQLCVGATFWGVAWFAGEAIARHGRPVEANGFVAGQQGLVVVGTALMVAGAAVAVASGVATVLAARSRIVRRSTAPAERVAA